MGLVATDKSSLICNGVQVFTIAMGSANQIAREFLLVLVALRALPRIQFSLQALVFFSHLLLKVHEVLSVVEFSKVCSSEKI